MLRAPESAASQLVAVGGTARNLLRIGPDIVERARQPFPGAPIRTLDAIHLASVLVARSAVAGLELLSLDARIRGVASMVGVRVQPRPLPPAR